MAYQINDSTRPRDPLPNLPLREIDVLPGPQTSPPATGDLTAGDGAAKSERLVPKISGYSVNVPQPDNKGPRVTAEGDGKNGMAG